MATPSIMYTLPYVSSCPPERIRLLQYDIPVKRLRYNISASKSKPVQLLAPLHELCIRVICKNIDLYDAGSFQGIPLDFVRRIVAQASSGHDNRAFGPWWLKVSTLPFSDLVPVDRIRYQVIANADIVSRPIILASTILTSFPDFDLLTTLVLKDTRCVKEYSGLTDENCHVLSELSNLAFLTMIHCQISNMGINRLARRANVKSMTGLWRLRGIWTLGCSAITDFGVDAFRRFPSLNVLSLQSGNVTSAGISVICRPNAEDGVPRWRKATTVHSPFYMWPGSWDSTKQLSTKVCEEDLVAFYKQLWPGVLPTSSPPGQRRDNEVQLHFGTMAMDNGFEPQRSGDGDIAVPSRTIPTPPPKEGWYIPDARAMTLMREPPNEAAMLKRPPAPVAPLKRASAPPKESPFKAVVVQKASKKSPLSESTGTSLNATKKSQPLPENLAFAPTLTKRSSGLGAVTQPIFIHSEQVVCTAEPANKKLKQEE